MPDINTIKKKNKKVEKKNEDMTKTQIMCVFFSIFAIFLSILTFALCTYKYFNTDIGGNKTPNNNTNDDVNQGNITSKVDIGLKSFNQAKEIN